MKSESTGSALFSFYDDAFHNLMATSSNWPVETQVLEVIDDLFTEYGEIAKSTLTPQLLFFVGPCQCFFRCAAQNALAGQFLGAICLNRACLENSLYALYFARKEEDFHVWMNRNEDKKSLRKITVIKNMLDEAMKLDPETARVADKLYEESIDFGAHPNVNGISVTHITETSPTNAKITFPHFQVGNLQHRYGLKFTSQIGTCALKFLKSIEHDRCAVIGLETRIDALPNLIDSVFARESN